MATPGWATYPGLDLYPGPPEPRIVDATPAPRTPAGLLVGSRTVSSRLVLRRGGVDVQDVPALSGRVSVDTTQTAPRRTLTATVAALPAWVPDAAGRGLLDPRAEDVTVRAEVNVSTPGNPGTPYAQGEFVLTKTSIKRSSDGLSLSISASDLTTRIRWRLMDKGLSIRAGATVAGAIGRLLDLDGRVHERRFDDGGQRIRTDMVAGKVGADPWAEAQVIASAYGLDLWVDRDGVERLAPSITAPASIRTWRTDKASVITDLSRDLDATSAPNGIVVEYTGGVLVTPPGATRLVVCTVDPTLLDSRAAAETAGKAQLAREQGMAESVTLSAWADYSLDDRDGIQVEDALSGTSSLQRVVGMDIDLTDPVMGVTLAQRRLT